MAVSNSQVNVATSATLIFADGGSVAGFEITLKNKGAAAVFLGDASVITGTGLELGPNESLTRNGASGESIYGIAASGSQLVHFLVTKN